METRYIVQFRTNVDGELSEWKDFRKSRYSKTYTLTKEEAFAYMLTLPITSDKFKGVREFRVISSVKSDGLLNQAVVTF